MYTIGIDARPLLTTPRTGIGEYTKELLSAVFELDYTNNYFLYFNSFYTKATYPESWKKTNIHFISTSYPNKLINGAINFFQRPHLDKLISYHFSKQTPLTNRQNLDFFFSPNINFISLSAVPKYILTIHDLSFIFFPEFFSKKQQYWHQLINPQKQCQKAHLIITPSKNTKQDLVNYLSINPEKIKVIYPGLSREFTQNFSDQHLAYVKKYYQLPENFILFLGTLEPRKNILTLIKAFELAHRFLPSRYYLVIAGSVGWKNKKIHEYIECSPLKNYIKVINYIDAKNKPYLYKLASLFVYPSFYEGFGFPVLEAMNSGIPVITINRASLPEITRQSAYLVNPHQPHALATGIITIINNPLIKNHFIQKGLEQAKNFSWKKAATEWLETLTYV